MTRFIYCDYVLSSPTIDYVYYHQTKEFKLTIFQETGKLFSLIVYNISSEGEHTFPSFLINYGTTPFRMPLTVYKRFLQLAMD